MVSGQYFNKGVKALDRPHVGHVVRETEKKIIVFGEANSRFDIPKSAIRFVSGNVLVDMPIDEITRRYKVKRGANLPPTTSESAQKAEDIDLATYEKRYPKSLFNKGVRANNEDKVGHIHRETDNKIIVFGEHNTRYDIPKSEIIAIGRNVILKRNYPELWKYRVDKNVQFPA